MAAEKIAVPSFERRKPARRPLPEHLPRERIVYPTCDLPMLWRQPIAQARRRRDRDAGARSAPVEGDPARAREARLPGLRSDHQPPAPSHPIARGRAGPKLLAHVLFAKYGLHLPLNRQSDVYQSEGIDLDVSTLADWVGASAATLSLWSMRSGATSSQPGSRGSSRRDRAFAIARQHPPAGVCPLMRPATVVPNAYLTRSASESEDWRRPASSALDPIADVKAAKTHLRFGHHRTDWSFGISMRPSNGSP